MDNREELEVDEMNGKRCIWSEQIWNLLTEWREDPLHMLPVVWSEKQDCLEQISVPKKRVGQVSTEMRPKLTIPYWGDSGAYELDQMEVKNTLFMNIIHRKQT